MHIIDTKGGHFAALNATMSYSSIHFVLTAAFLCLSCSSSLLKNINVESLLKGTTLANKQLGCFYQASTNGWTHRDFHSCCDFNPPLPTLILMKTKTGSVCGGYNPVGWQSRDDYKDSLQAFLFRIDSNGEVLKAKKIGGSSAAVYDFGDRAIWFAEALFVPLNPKYGKLRVGTSALGTSYSSLPGSQGSIFNERGNMGSAELSEIECWSSDEFIAQSVNMASRERDNESRANVLMKGMRRFERFLLGEQ